MSHVKTLGYTLAVGNIELRNCQRRLLGQWLRCTTDSRRFGTLRDICSQGAFTGKPRALFHLYYILFYQNITRQAFWDSGAEMLLGQVCSGHIVSGTLLRIHSPSYSSGLYCFRRSCSSISSSHTHETSFMLTESAGGASFVPVHARGNLMHSATFNDILVVFACQLDRFHRPHQVFYLSLIHI